MSFSRLAQSKKFKVPVEAIALLLVLAKSSVASTAPSWSSQPSWASAEANSNARKSAIIPRDSRAVSPFSPGSNNLSLDVGQVFLMGDLGSRYADNIGSRLHYTYGVSDLFGFDASLGYSEHSDGQFSMTTLLTGLRTNLAWYDKVIPYVVFGLGFYKPSYQQTITLNANGSSTVNPGTSISPVLFGVHFGPGVDLELTKEIFFGAGLTFHDVFGQTKVTAQGPMQVGGTFTSFLLRAGVTF